MSHSYVRNVLREVVSFFFFFFHFVGMMFGGGCGHQLAEWIVHGRPSLDMYGYDIRRFHPSLSSNPAWVNQRSHESYAKNYAMVFPHDQALGEEEP